MNDLSLSNSELLLDRQRERPGIVRVVGPVQKTQPILGQPCSGEKCDDNITTLVL